MDTPERTQIGIPISKFEVSPFSNFVNSLSPIKSAKTMYISQAISSVSCTSPPSVFTSPHASLQKESRILRRHQSCELKKPECSSSNKNKEGRTEGVTDAAQQPENSTGQAAQGTGISSGEGSLEPQVEVELPTALKYDTNSPGFNTALPSGSQSNCEPGTSSLVPFVDEHFRRDSVEAELNSQETEENKDGANCDWESLISDAADLLVFDSPNDASSKASFQKQQDSGGSFFASLLSHFPQDDATHQRSAYHLGSTSCDDQDVTEDQLSQSLEAYGLEQIHHSQDNLASTSMNDYFIGNQNEKSDNEPTQYSHRGMRRRCLVFEIPGARKSADGYLVSSSTQDEEKVVNNSKQLVPLKSGGDSSQCILPGIGLHLNALAVASKNRRILKRETVSSEGQLRVSPMTTLESLVNSSHSTSLEKDMGAASNDIQVTEDTSQASAHVGNEELAQDSPKKKRRRLENTGAGEACKRCKCKKSRCLKLYCECFAAGVYCVEPCSCQDCFNKPIHEDTVLTTRKQIESRNPLAFAPKVIRNSDSIPDLGDESTRTPASARHKRGCNCKKSSCLKKYCECYQGGVGCSISCRCERCKNAFGRKDGSIILGRDEFEEETLAREKSLVEKGLDQSGIQNEEQNSESNVPQTPLRLFRSSAPYPVFTKGKPPRSSSAAIGSSSVLHPSHGSTFLRSQPKTVKHPQAVSGDEMPAVLQNNGSPSGGIKALSPNSKRVSPPHNDLGRSPRLRSSRKMILQSIPSFPSLTPRRLGEFQ
ncbi:hypothetical protein Ancab_013311 [Ancistrocladus abbreviatus]